MRKKVILFFSILLFSLSSNMVMAREKIQEGHVAVKKHLTKNLLRRDHRGSYQVWGRHYHVMRTSKNYEEKGVASWYGRQFHLRRTSSGERYNMYRMTAAHKTLPLATYVQVTNLRNGRKVVVKVNDRGPFIANRLIDLSYGAARKLGMVALGTVPVNIKALG